MRSFTVISLGASTVLGIAALLVAKSLMSETGPEQATSSAPTRAVVVARSDIKYGVKLKAADLSVVRAPEGSIPKAAYSRIEDVIQGDDGPIVLTSLSANEALLPTKLSIGSGRASLSAMVAPGMRAYTIRVSDVLGGGGHVLPGDHVDVVLTRDAGGAGEGDGTPRKRGDLLLQDARVLGMDMIADPAATDKFIPKTTTLEVTLEDAARLAVAGEIGALSLSLRPAGSAERQVLRTITNDDLQGAGGLRIAPQRVRSAAPRPPPPKAAPSTRMLVIQGEKSVQVDVPSDRGAGV